MTQTSYQPAPPGDGLVGEAARIASALALSRQGLLSTCPPPLLFPRRGWHRSGFAPARMKSRLLLSLLSLLGSFAARAAVLPGFGVKFLGATGGFPTSVAVDSGGVVYYTTTKGDIFRFVDGQSVFVAHVDTVADG